MASERPSLLTRFMASGPIQAFGQGAMALAVASSMGATLAPAPAQAQVPVIDSAVRQDAAVYETAGGTLKLQDERSYIERPHVPNDSGNGVYAFDRASLDWKRFDMNRTVLAPSIESPYTKDHIRAVPWANDRAAIIGTGPASLIADDQGRPYQLALLATGFHLGAEGLAVAAGGNPAYAKTAVRTVAGDPQALAEAMRMGTDTESLRKAVTAVSQLEEDRVMAPTFVAGTPTVVPVERGHIKPSDVASLPPKELAAYAMAIGETMHDVQRHSDPAAAKNAAIIAMAGAQAHFDATRTHGKVFDFPGGPNPEWAAQKFAAVKASVQASVVVHAPKGAPTPKGRIDQER